MSIQVSFKVDADNMQIICVDCMRRATIHRVSRYGGFAYMAHVSCHREHRMISIPEMAVQRAVRALPDGAVPRYTAIWDQVADYVADSQLSALLEELEQSAASARANVEEVYGALSPGTPIVMEIEDYIANRRADAEAVRTVMRAKAGELPDTSVQVAGAPMTGTCDGCGLDLAWAAKRGVTGHACYADNGPKLNNCRDEFNAYVHVETFHVTPGPRVSVSPVKLTMFPPPSGANGGGGGGGSGLAQNLAARELAARSRPVPLVPKFHTQNDVRLRDPVDELYYALTRDLAADELRTAPNVKVDRNGFAVQRRRPNEVTVLADLQDEP